MHIPLRVGFDDIFPAAEGKLQVRSGDVSRAETLCMRCHPCVLHTAYISITHFGQRSLKILLKNNGSPQPRSYPLKTLDLDQKGWKRDLGEQP
jgi:hypothetical protein